MESKKTTVKEFLINMGHTLDAIECYDNSLTDGTIDLLFVMEEYAKIYHESKVKKDTNSVSLFYISNLANEYKKEELPNSDVPYHYEAEAASGIDSFVNWLKQRYNK